MAEGEKRNLENVADIEKEYSEVSGGVAGQDENKYYHNANNVEEKSENGKPEINIKGVLQNAEEQIFSEFISANSDIEAKSKSELTGDALAKYEEFLKSERVGEIYSETDEKIKGINKSRNYNLKDLGERIDELRTAVDQKLESTNKDIEEIEKSTQEEIARLKAEKEKEISAKEAEINALDSNDPEYSEKLAQLNKEKATLSNELSELSKDIAENSEYKKLLDGNSKYVDLLKDKEKLQEIRKNIGPSREERQTLAEQEGKKESEVDYGLSKDLRKSLSNQKDLREKAQEKAKEIFGEDRVKDDFGINQEEKDKKDKDKEGENLEENAPEQEQQGQTKAQAGQIDPKTLAAIQQAMKNAGVTPQQAGANVVGEQVAGEQVEAPEPTGMDYLSSLGYNGGDVLNAKSSIALLSAFVSVGDKNKIAILSDDQAKSVIFEAMKQANSRKTPLTAIKFNKTRRELIKMANGPMMRKALESVGKDVDYNNLEDVNKQFNNVMRDYDYIRQQKENEIAKLPDGEEKDRLQAELAEYDKKYSAMKGVKDFRNITNKDLTRFRDKVVDKVSSIFDRNKVDRLNPPSAKEMEAQDSRNNMYNRTRTVIEQNKEKNEFQARNQSAVNSPEVADESEKQRAEAEKIEEKQKIQQADEIAKKGAAQRVANEQKEVGE